jgi:DNA-binding MarR family transcriptional regulator
LIAIATITSVNLDCTYSVHPPSKDIGGGMNQFSTWLIEKRRWEFEQFQFSRSAIAYDVVLCLYNLHQKNQNFAMKDVYRSLPYSESQVRSVIRSLEKDGLLTLSSGRDRRRRVFSITSRLDDLMAEYRKLLKQCP